RDKDDIKVVKVDLKWFFVPENAERYMNPGQVTSLKRKDMKLKTTSLVNVAMDQLELIMQKRTWVWPKSGIGRRPMTAQRFTVSIGSSKPTT
ncbi:hypothetical protein BG015_006015, partial [Linnemannia schmuckeri]